MAASTRYGEKIAKPGRFSMSRNSSAEPDISTGVPHLLPQMAKDLVKRRRNLVSRQTSADGFLKQNSSRQNEEEQEQE